MNDPRSWLILGGIAAAFLAIKIAAHLWASTPLTVIAAGVGWVWAGMTYGHGPIAIAAGCAAGLVTYVGSTLIRPRADCWWCGGKSKRRDGGGPTFRFCWACGGRGWKLRAGSRLRSRYRDDGG